MKNLKLSERNELVPFDPFLSTSPVYQKRKKQHAAPKFIAFLIVLLMIAGVFSIWHKANAPEREIAAAGESLYEQAVAAYEEGDLETALDLANAIDPNYGKAEQVDELKKDIAKTLLLQNVGAYEEAEDYLSILHLIENYYENPGDDAEVYSCYLRATAEYRAQVLEKATEAVQADQYAEALGYINEGLLYLPNDTQLNAMKESLTTNQPVNLLTIKPFFVGDLTLLPAGLTDTWGNTYESAIYGQFSETQSDYRDSYYIWMVNGEYEKMTGTALVNADNETSNDEQRATIRIYGDDMLLYQRAGMDRRSKPEKFEIDLKGIQEIRVELYEESDGMFGLHLSPVLANVYLHQAK